MTQSRRGPGRPRLHENEKTQPYTVSLTPNEAERVREIGNGNLTEGVRKMLGINETRRRQVEIDGHLYTLVQDWLDQYDLYDGDTHLGTFHFSAGHDGSRGFSNSYGVNLFVLTQIGGKNAYPHYVNTVQDACEYIVREYARRSEA